MEPVELRETTGTIDLVNATLGKRTMKKRGAPLIPSDYCRSTQLKWRNVTERRQTLSRIQDPMSYLPGEIDKHSVKVETTWQANKTTKRRAKFLHTMRHHSINLKKTEVS